MGEKCSKYKRNTVYIAKTEFVQLWVTWKSTFGANTFILQHTLNFFSKLSFNF